MSIEIEAIKDAVYELEGLLELAELREDKLPALLPLMKNKLKLINTLFEDSKIDDSSEEDVFPEEIEDSIPTENETPAIEEEKLEETVEESVEEPVAEEKVEEPAEEESVEAEEENPFLSEKVEEIATVEEDYTPDFSSSSDEALFVAEDADEDDLIYSAPGETKEEVKEEVKEDVKRTVRPAVDPNAPKPAFCINDRFRFRRELFGNSDAAFNSAMDLVATMDDYQEAEDYFLADLGWDTEKPEVMDFMAIIRTYFEK